MPLVVGMAARAAALLFASGRLTGPDILGPVQITSTNVETVKYDRKNRLMYVRFTKSGEYVYFDIGESVYKALLNSPSKGKFIHENVKDRYEFDRI